MLVRFAPQKIVQKFLEKVLTSVYTSDKLDAMSIKELRRRLGISQEELARRLGVSLQTIHRWESGKTTPSPMARLLLRILFDDKE